MKSVWLSFLPPPAKSIAGALGLTLWLVLLSGCTNDEPELRDWMVQVRHDVKPNITPLVAPKKFFPQAYEMLAAVEPFSSQKLTVTVKKEAKQPNSLLTAEINRPKQPLEAHPLDAISMVGSFVKHGKQFALVKVDNLLYEVRLGDFLGQNYGKVVRITETEISLREIVQDASGDDLIERPGTLHLQEKSR